MLKFDVLIEFLELLSRLLNEDLTIQCVDLKSLMQDFFVKILWRESTQMHLKSQIKSKATKQDLYAS